MSSHRALNDQLVAPLRRLVTTLHRWLNPRAARLQVPRASGDSAKIFVRARPGRISLTERYRFEQAISVNPAIKRAERSGRIEVTVPYDGDKCFTRKAIEDLRGQIGSSSDNRSGGNGERSALIGHLALANIKMANLPDGSPLAARHSAIPLYLLVRSSTVDDDVLTFDDREAVLRTDYVPDVLDDYPLPLKVTAEVFDPEDNDPEDNEERPGSTDDDEIRNIVRQPAFSSELQFRFQIFLMWPRRRGKPRPDAQVKRVSLEWPTVTSLEPNSLRFTLGGELYKMQYNPATTSLEWAGIPIDRGSDDPEESNDSDAGDAAKGDDERGQSQTPSEVHPKVRSTSENVPDSGATNPSTTDGDQAEDDLGDTEGVEIWKLQSQLMSLQVRQPGQLRHQDDLRGTVEIEVVDELLSGIEARLFDAIGRRAQPGSMSVRTKLRMDFRLVLDDEFSKRKMSATHTIHFDEVVPNLHRVDDITAVLRDRGFHITRNKNTIGGDQPLWLIHAERREGPDEIRLNIVVSGRHYLTERHFETPGWHDYTTELGSGELRLTVYGQVPRSSRELTTEVNELRQALTDRFNRMKSQR